MKKICLLISIALTFPLFAGEFTGAGQAINVLKAHNLSVPQLKKQGFKVLLGEITGAGKKLDLDRINLIITNKFVFDMSRASHIQFIHPSQAKSLSDVEHLEFSQMLVKPTELTGIVYK